MIYLDYAATTPMNLEAINVYSEVATQFYGNPSSLHDIGSSAQSILERSRELFATFINGDARGIYFTSGGSESNYLAIHSLLNGNSQKGKHIITTDIEHSSIRNTLEALKKEGYEISTIGVNEVGRIDLDALRAAIRPDTVLATIHHGNSEIGTVQDIEEIGKILNNHGVLFHSDCVQTFGKIAIDVKKAKLDSISVSSHKIYGPKGVGLCYINPTQSWKPTVPNTTHESGFRPGTVNVPGIAAFITAAEISIPKMSQEQARFAILRRKFLDGVKSDNWNIIEEGPATSRLEHIIGIRIDGIEGQYTMLECNRYGVAISTGSACAVGKQSPTKTILALGRSKEEAKQFVRLSLGAPTTEQEIDQTITIFNHFLNKHYNLI
ncbi:IscS subfamily cysteine desulfurase [Bacillus sp. Marseille-P3661]|uniref:IscS subfamily cysteine desulfurase n=1 Tax=Bacillus sp. Marseille-P3661 TaxID=1936234 RepID=UPI000C85A489|nr:IscS subfamily cysteine desulfurase [Bacillus sp. Marseille-P3661]